MKLPESDYQLLRALQRNSKQKRNYVKITVLLMLHLGKNEEEIALCLGISVSTISHYEKKYLAEGLELYLKDAYQVYTGKLNESEQNLLCAELDVHLYKNTAEIADFVQKAFGKSYTCQGLALLLKRLGFSYKKTKLVPCEANLDKQAAFVEEFENMMAVLSDQESVYFIDAVHPQHNTRPAYAWIRTGEEREIPSNSGRKRLNLNGAMNAHHPSEILLLESERINAQSTWELYKKIEEKEQDKVCIYAISDQARYYKNKMLQEKLATSRIKQIFLPAYSPNLNLIERLWKFMRKKAIDTEFCRNFEEFRQRIHDFFNRITCYKEELENLISWNFHIPRSQTNFY